jgi:hypothetical protein
MDKANRLKIVRRLQERGYTLSGWCRANGFVLRTVQDFIYHGTGLKRGGERTGEILEALERYGLLSERRAPDPGRRRADAGK